MRDRFDNSGNDEITCPWCGYEFSESYDWDDDEGDDECPECDKMFSFERFVECTYTTYRDCAANDDKHDWEFRREFDDGDKLYYCNNCDKTKFEGETSDQWRWQV